MVYGEHAVASLLHRVGSSQEALLEALARRGVQVPAGSGLRWGFNWYPQDPEGQDRPRRAWVDAEEGIDLDAALALARERAGS